MQSSIIREEEKLSQLTTPVLKDADAVFPGENWFFYWKTSTSLWRSKLQEFSGGRTIMVPLNWAFHSDTGETIDFGTSRPETDLKKLTEIAEELGKTLVFLLPLTPAPFLTNGGVPSLLARTMTLDEDQMLRMFFDNEGAINKIASFYDSRVFQAYTKFVKYLGSYFEQLKISNGIWGIECGAISGDKFVSYFEDRSQVYEQSFSLFLSNRPPEINEPPEVDPVEKEEKLKEEFQETISALYLNTASKALERNWDGTLKVAFLRGGRSDFFNSLQGGQTTTHYMDSLQKMMCRCLIPSSVLVPAAEKEGTLGKMLNNQVYGSYLMSTYDQSITGNHESIQFRPLSFFEVYQGKHGKNWKDIGLTACLEERFGWTYHLHEDRHFNFDEEKDLNEVFFFHLSDLKFKNFSEVLKIFLNGGKVVISKDGADQALIRRLESFILENDLEVEKVNFHTLVECARLGEGVMVLFDSSPLTHLGGSKVSEFWNKVIDLFQIHHLRVEGDSEVVDSWRWRISNTNELSFESIRRLDLYNPTSYRKKVKVQLSKNCVLTKVLDKYRVEVESAQHVVHVSLMPQGCVSLDLGLFGGEA